MRLIKPGNFWRMNISNHQVSRIAAGSGRSSQKSDLTAHRPQTPPLYKATKLVARRPGRLSSYGTGAFGLLYIAKVSFYFLLLLLTARGTMEANPVGTASPPAQCRCTWY